MAEIEQLNVRNAAHLAMRRALRRLPLYDHVLIDGQKITGMEEHIGPYTPIVKGDASSYAIACASVIAKVTRDRLMARLAYLRPPGSAEVRRRRQALLHSSSQRPDGHSRLKPVQQTRSIQGRRRRAELPH